MPEYLVGHDPRDASPLESVQISSALEIREAVEKARDAARSFRELSFDERYELLERGARRLLERRSAGVALAEKEIGKVHADALFTEGLGPLDAVKGWKRVISSSAQGKISLNPIAFPKKSARIDLEPRGVIGVIAPWNFPIAGLYRSVFPALLLGNAVVLKPSELAPRSTRWFHEQLREVLPPNVLQVVYGGGEVGRALLEAGIDGCVFTGSTRVGLTVEARAFELGIPCSAEMGGNDAAIVLDDADLNRTTAGLVHWALQNAGQACGAVEVVFADSRIAPELERRLADACSRLRPPVVKGGPGSVAPLVHERQLQIVLEHIDDARSKGANVLVGGTHDELLVAPTVLGNCTDEMRVVQEESFGPLIPVVAVDGPFDAIRRVNAGRYGLTASLWTEDLERANRLARELDVGVVTVNNHAFTGAIVDLPWSGRRGSGRGIANSAWSLLTFARPKTVVIDQNKNPEPFWVPFDDDLSDLGELLAELQLGHIGRAYKLPLLLRRRLQTVKKFFGF